MIRVFVLEDEEQSRKALIKMIQNISAELTVDAAADLASARKLLRSTVSFDLFLLDINLDTFDCDDIGGICFAEEIRSIPEYGFTPIVMVTSVAGMEMEAYRKLHCYQYLVKPYDSSEIENLIRKVMMRVSLDRTPSLTVKKDGINYKISCSDICFIKAIPRGVCLYLKTEKMEVPYLSIRQLLEKLPEKMFFQCHRMFVVNREYVKYFDLVNQFIRVTHYDEEIEIGVTFKQEVRRIMND